MRIHNYGNDYAYQQKQKSKENAENAHVVKEPVQEPEKPMEDAGNQNITEVQEPVCESCSEKEQVSEEIGGQEESQPTEAGREAETAQENCKKKKK